MYRLIFLMFFFVVSSRLKPDLSPEFYQAAAKKPKTNRVKRNQLSPAAGP